MPLSEGSERPQTLGEALALLGVQESVFRAFVARFDVAAAEGWETFVTQMIINDFDGLSETRSDPAQLYLALMGIASVAEKDRPDTLEFPLRLATIRDNLRGGGVSEVTIKHIEQTVGFTLGTQGLRPTKFLLGHLLNLNQAAVRQRIATDGSDRGVFVELMAETHRRIRETINQSN